MERNKDENCSGGSSASSSRTTADSVPVPSQGGTSIAPSSSKNGTGVPRYPSSQNTPITNAGTNDTPQYNAAPQYLPMAQPQHNLTNGAHANHSNSREAFAANPGAELVPFAPRMRNPAPPHIFTRGRNARRSSGPYQLRPVTFWTWCDRCRVHYEYRRIYLNKILLCTVCRVPFMAVETPAPYVNRRM